MKDMKKKKLDSETLCNHLQEVVATLPDPTEILRGTVGRRYVRCGKPGCRCETGQGHGPVYYLTVTIESGKTEQISLSPEDYELACRYVQNYKQFLKILDHVSTINRDIFKQQRISRKESSRLSRRPKYSVQSSPEDKA